MKSVFHIAIAGAFTVAIFIGLQFRSVAAPPTVLRNLSLKEFVSLVNENTSFQLNLELANSSESERIDINSENLDKLSIPDLLNVLVTIGGYSLVTNAASIFTISPTRYSLDTAYELNYTVNDFAVTNAHPFKAARLLASAIPFPIECAEPFPFTSKFGPVFLENDDWPHWPSNSLKSVTLSSRSKTMRDWLCALFNSQRKSYWIVAPVENGDTIGRRTMTLFVHCPEELIGLGIIARKDGDEIARRAAEWDEHKGTFSTNIFLNLMVNTNLVHEIKVFATKKESGYAFVIQLQPVVPEGNDSFPIRSAKGSLVASNALQSLLNIPIASTVSSSFSSRANGPVPTARFSFFVNEKVGSNLVCILSVPGLRGNQRSNQWTTYYHISLRDLMSKGKDSP